MAGNTIFRCWPIEKHRLGGYETRKFVTLPAAHILMRASQRESSPLLVIEERRFPLHTVVTFSTWSNVRFGELLPVNVFVTVFAL